MWADEPTGALDSVTSQEVIDLMLRLNREHALTFVWVTHALEVARQAQRLIEMRDGLIEKDSTFNAGLPSSVDASLHVNQNQEGSAYER